MDSLIEEELATDAFRNDPYPLYDKLRRLDPVYWSDSWGCWLLTRYADVASVLLDPRRFSNRDRVTNVIRQTYNSDLLNQVDSLLRHFKQGLINSDPPDHTRLRKLIQRTFLPRTLEGLRPKIQTQIDVLLDRVQAKGSMELVRDMAFPLPVSVIAELFGVPGSMHEDFKRWSTAILEFQAYPNAQPETVLRSQAALLEMRDFLKDYLAVRRRFPKSDLVSDLLAAEEEGDRLSEEELLSTGVSLLVAGHETTTNLISSTVYLLLKHPEQWKSLRANPRLTPNAVEESLRFESPLQRLGRTALSDAEIGGRSIGKGQTILSLLGAANRDPERFDDPNRFDIERDAKGHLAFGQGIHFCIGAPLSRLEVPMVIKSLMGRYPKLSLAQSPVEWHSGVMRGLQRLDLSLA